jgi:hypothetical protein
MTNKCGQTSFIMLFASPKKKKNLNNNFTHAHLARKIKKGGPASFQPNTRFRPHLGCHNLLQLAPPAEPYGSHAPWQSPLLSPQHTSDTLLPPPPAEPEAPHAPWQSTTLPPQPSSLRSLSTQGFGLVHHLCGGQSLCGVFGGSQAGAPDSILSHAPGLPVSRGPAWIKRWPALP